ncbi:hypothetical protein Tco_1513960, partial [Tanacetum coccineum]
DEVGNDDVCMTSTPYSDPSQNEDFWQSTKTIPTIVNDSDSEEMEELILENHIVNRKKEINANKEARASCEEISYVLLCFDPGIGPLMVRFGSKLIKMSSFARDFNAALNLDDKSVGSSKFDISMREFRDCVEEIKVSNVNYTGLKFTWNQKPKGDKGILKKIDGIMANMEFKDLVKEEWSILVCGFHMYQVVKKLKHLKKPLHLDKDPSNQILREEEAEYVKAFNDALLMEERFLKQKAKIEWLHVGDSNSAYFHKVVKGRIHRSMIDAVTSMEGTTFTGDQVPVVFEAHYSSFLGQQGVHQTLYSENLFINRLDPNVTSFMIRPLSNHEIKEAIFSMGNDKSLGSDGYAAVFFKEAWDIVSNDVTMAVKEFFTNGNLLKEVNHT